AVLVMHCRCSQDNHSGRYLPPAQTKLRKALQQPDDWFKSDVGRRISQNIVTWQNDNGGWWKKYDPSIPRPMVLPPPNPLDAPPGDEETVWRGASTMDNGATYTEM